MKVRSLGLVSLCSEGGLFVGCPLLTQDFKFISLWTITFCHWWGLVLDAAWQLSLAWAACYLLPILANTRKSQRQNATMWTTTGVDTLTNQNRAKRGKISWTLSGKELPTIHRAFQWVYQVETLKECVWNCVPCQSQSHGVFVVYGESWNSVVTCAPCHGGGLLACLTDTAADVTNLGMIQTKFVCFLWIQTS